MRAPHRAIARTIGVPPLPPCGRGEGGGACRSTTRRRHAPSAIPAANPDRNARRRIARSVGTARTAAADRGRPAPGSRHRSRSHSRAGARPRYCRSSTCTGYRRCCSAAADRRRWPGRCRHRSRCRPAGRRPRRSQHLRPCCRSPSRSPPPPPRRARCPPRRCPPPRCSPPAPAACSRSAARRTAGSSRPPGGRCRSSCPCPVAPSPWGPWAGPPRRHQAPAPCRAPRPAPSGARPGCVSARRGTAG